MDDLWRAIGALAARLQRDRAASIAEAISQLASVAAFDLARPEFQLQSDRKLIEQLQANWLRAPGISAREVAGALRSAAEAGAILGESTSVELVWTGPKTGLIPTRRTEQVILDVIASAVSEIFLVTYAFHDAAAVVAALKEAVKRGVSVRVLFESKLAQSGGGSGSAGIAGAVPGASLYVWNEGTRTPDGSWGSASVHAKCIVADHRLAFITSANLTTAAMERNMELGILVRGGDVPRRLHDHLQALLTTKVIKPLSG